MTIYVKMVGHVLITGDACVMAQLGPSRMQFLTGLSQSKAERRSNED